MSDAAERDPCRGWINALNSQQGPGALARVVISSPGGGTRTVMVKHQVASVQFKPGDVVTCTHGAVQIRAGNGDLFLHTELHATPRHSQRRQIIANRATSDVLLEEDRRASPPPRAAVTPSKDLDLTMWKGTGAAPVAARYLWR